ncbi:type IV secretory system conjugative DNA transfer family protein, partial [Acinetobacter baumannii]
MTQPANVNSTVKALLILVGIALFSIMWAWLSGGIFLELTGGKIDDATPLTLYQYWKWYGGHQVVLQKIYIAAGITTAVFVLIGLIFLKGSRATLHGDAQWASKAQVKASGLMGEDGIIVGQYGGRYLMLGGQQHVLRAAPTRSGKGVGIVIPNLLSWRDSVVVLDIKRENYNLTAGFRKQHGQAVYLFNPVASDFSTHRWNPFTYVNTDDQVFAINDIQKIANFLWPDPDNADPIWTASSRSLLLGVALYIIETPGLKLTMGECLRQATQSEETAKFFQRQINERIEAGTPLTAACVRA